MADDLARQLRSLRHGDHVCHWYDRAADRLAAVVPFLVEGLARGEQCLHVGAGAATAAAVAALEAAGVAVAAERRRGALRFLDDVEFYRGTDGFDLDAVFGRISQLQWNAAKHGFAGIRGVGDMAWALVAEVGPERLIQYEARLNQLIPGQAIITLCQYERGQFAPRVLRDVLRAHPFVILDGQLCANLYYEPPDLILGAADDAARLDWQVAQLLRTNVVERERERLHERLHLERSSLETIVRHMPAGVLVVEAGSGRVVLDNLQLATIGGQLPRPRPTLGDYRDWQAFFPDGRPYAMEQWPLLRSLNAGERVTDEEMRLLRDDGSQAVVSVSAAPVLDAAGAVVAAVVVVHDITGRKGIEEALRASELRYRQLFERNLAAVYRSSLDGRLLDCNDAFAHILGHGSREEVLSCPALDFYFHPADRDAFVSSLRQFRSLSNYESRMRRRDGSAVWVLENTSLLTNDGDPIIEGTFVDITSRKQAEEESYVSAARYRSLIENLTQGIALKDASLRFVVANRPFCDALDLREAALVGKTEFDVRPHAAAEPHHADDLRVLSRGERVEREEDRIVEGKPRTVRIVKTPVTDERGHVVGVLGIYWDVTEQHTLEAQLRQAQKMEAVGLLAGGIAHDFNNLLAVIVGNIALSLGSLPEGHAHRELLHAAERAGVQAAELTNQLLGFSRQTILRPVPSQLHGCVEETVRLLRRTIDPRIHLEVAAAANPWTVEADPNQMSQVLMNLCLNARDAMPDGGRLRLECENVVVEDDYARQHLEARCGDFVRLRVSDTGHGIAPEIRTRIFEPFFTTKSAGKGTGLGLAMVFGIIKQHQGWIDCYSEVGTGTRFDIYLPRHGSAGEVGPTPLLPAQPVRGGTETILLADDEPMIRALGRTILQRYGYQVILAEDGLEAVELYERHGGEIGLVVLDLTMPRLSGHDALPRLLRLNPAVRVVFASGYSAEHLTPIHHAQIAGFISKPFRPEKLAQIVREALDRVDGVTAASRSASAASPA